MNIGSKLILSFLLVTLLPTILLAFLTTTIISNSTRDVAQETINNNLKAAWMQYYARAYQMQYGMLQASTEPHIQNAMLAGDRAFLRGQLKRWKVYRPNVDLWAFVDRDSRVIASYSTPGSAMKLSINGLVEKSLKLKTSSISTEVIPYDVLREQSLDRESLIQVVDEAEPERKSAPRGAAVVRDGLMLTVVTPVKDASNRVIGAIISGDLINNDTSVPDTFAEIIPGSLVTISMNDVQISTNVVNEKGKRTIGSLVPADVYSEINKNRGFRGEASIARKSYITAFDPILNYEGNIVGSLFVGVPKERFVELQYENIKAIIFIALIGLFMATAVASFITYLITRPIKSLTKKAQLVSAGNLDVRPAGPQKEGSNDEIADLATTFENMLGNLREHEARLSTQKNLIESIINSLPYCLYVIDRDLGIVVWNRHASVACPICQCNSSENCYGLNFIAHLPHESLKSGMQKVLMEVFETGKPSQFEQRITVRKPEAGDLYIQTSIFPILSERGGEADYVVWMAEDITRKKDMEASVISSEKLVAIGQLAAGVAHEVNNPLGGILNCLYNIRNMKLADERKTEYLDFMEEGIKRVQNIVRQLLDFSQQYAPERALTDVNGLIEGIIPLFIHSIKSVRSKDVRLVKNLGHGLPAILVDKHQLEQVLVNLILNALQAVSGDGLIEVATTLKNDWFCITVSDNGCGISPENLVKIFDPFFTTKGVGKGTGLGLSVSRGIIERHKGRIEVESHCGKGTVFKVYLPVSAGLGS